MSPAVGAGAMLARQRRLEAAERAEEARRRAEEARTRRAELRALTESLQAASHAAARHPELTSSALRHAVEGHERAARAHRDAAELDQQVGNLARAALHRKSATESLAAADRDRDRQAPSGEMPDAVAG